MPDIRDEMCQVIEELVGLQLITSTGGNVSARTSDNLEQAWITPSGMYKGALSPDMLVRIGSDGRSAYAGQRAPSSEWLIHAAILRARPDVTAVVHCHAPKATTLVNCDLPFLPISTESAFLARTGSIPFIMPGTDALASALVNALGQGWAVLMKNHGLIVAAPSLRRAADITQIVERTADILLGCHAVGRTPPVLPAELVDSLASKRDLMA